MNFAYLQWNGPADFLNCKYIYPTTTFPTSYIYNQ